MIAKPKRLPKLFSILCFCLGVSTACIAQSNTIKGSVTDTVSKTGLPNAVIYIKSPKDSGLINYTRADAKGGFELPNVPIGKYIMVVSYPNYVDWIDSVTIQMNAPVIIPVYLTTKAHLLEEVIVRQTIAPIRIKGDTTEYLADSFHVKPGATVEDLLKVMPGISVNSKGEITTQGQKVQKVLVDGDEFFGDDPTMATQNLNAKDVAKVQVYDRKSDQSVLTGIDDGTKQKTVNLVLKEDAKKGYFGKVEAGSDFNKYYQSKLTASRFTNTLKAGVLISADRTGRNGMNWEEMQDYGSITSTVENGDVSFSWEGDNAFDNYNQQGIPENLQTAVMMNKKFGKLKSSTANNYTYNHLNLAGDGYTATQYILPDTVYYNNQASHNNSSRWKQNGSTRNEFNIDSLTTVTVNARGSYGKSSSYSAVNGEYLTGTKVPVNTNTRTNYLADNSDSRKADIFLKRKLNKTGTRFLTLSTGMSANHTTSDGYLFNETNFYNNGLPASRQTIDQRKENINESKSMQALASYLEPISKKLSLNINYTYNSSNSEQDTRSYEKRNGKYDSLNFLYSNHYRFINRSQRVGAGFNYITRKITAKIGLAIQDLSLKQTNIYKDSSYARNFTNFFPNANMRWKFSTSGSLYLNYNGSTQQPSLMQIQPILNNNDPLNLVLGNPDLKPAFNHNLYINVGDSKVLTGRNIWGYGSVTFTQNAFSSKSVVDALGRRSTQTVNVNGNYNFYSGLSYSRKIKFMNLDVSFDPRFSGSRYLSFVNGLQNITKSYTVTPGISIRRYIEKKMSVYLSYRPDFSHAESSINSGIVTEYWTQSVNMYANYHFKSGWDITNNISGNYRQKLSPSDKNNNALIWDISVEKKIFKKQGITAILSVNDLLNQRIGFNRNIASNYITENTYTTVQRYALFSLRWKFNKNRKADDDE